MQAPICSPAENECYQKLEHKTFDCKVACTGVFADINVKKREKTFTNDIAGFKIEKNEEQYKFERLLMQYGKYKNDLLESIKFEKQNIYTGGYSTSSNPVYLHQRTGSNYSKF